MAARSSRGGDRIPIDRAHKIILQEELQTADRNKLYGLLVRAMTQAISNSPTSDDMRTLLEEDASTPLEATRQSVLRTRMQDEDALLKYMREQNQAGTQPDTQRTLLSVARATCVVGSMIQGLNEGGKRNAAVDGSGRSTPVGIRRGVVPWRLSARLETGNPCPADPRALLGSLPELAKAPRSGRKVA